MAPMTESPRPDRPPTSPGLATRVTGEARLPAVADALASAVAVSGIPLRLFVAPYRGTRDRATVAVAVEIDVSPLRLVAKNGTVTVPIEVTYVATDSRGKVLPGHRHATTLGIKESAVDRVRTDGVRVLSEFSLAPGRYQIRVAAGSAATAGSVLADLEIPEFGKGPLAMSGIFLSSDRAATVTTLTPIAPLGGALPWSPSARRDFGREETLGLFVEVYENAPTETRPHAIAWTASLRGESGTALPLATERRATSTSGTPPPYRFTARVPLVSVAPGSYVLEVEARSDLEDNVAVTRRLPIHVR
jgi:hypothetical protein